MKRLTVVLTLALGLLVLASPAGAMTKPKAFAKAKTCLLASGKVRFVAPRGGGGGYAFFKRYKHIVYWKYSTFFGQVDSVTVYEFSLPANLRRTFRHCVRVA
jgi:hypothetical protein